MFRCRIWYKSLFWDWQNTFEKSPKPVLQIFHEGTRLWLSLWHDVCASPYGNRFWSTRHYQKLTQKLSKVHNASDRCTAFLHDLSTSLQPATSNFGIATFCISQFSHQVCGSTRDLHVAIFGDRRHLVSHGGGPRFTSEWKSMEVYGSLEILRTAFLAAGPTAVNWRRSPHLPPTNAGPCARQLAAWQNYNWTLCQCLRLQRFNVEIWTNKILGQEIVAPNWLWWPKTGWQYKSLWGRCHALFQRWSIEATQIHPALAFTARGKAGLRGLEAGDSSTFKISI